jgi:hypothetical protein
MSPLSDRLTAGTDRLAAVDRPRDPQAVTLSLVDGARVHGVLHRAPGTRTLDYLNRQAETFVAMTDAVVTTNGESESVEFIAINKSHIVRLVEVVDEA